MSRPRPHSTIPYSSILMDTETVNLDEQVPPTIKELCSQNQQKSFTSSISCSRSTLKQPLPYIGEDLFNKQDFANYADTLMKLQHKHQNLTQRKSLNQKNRRSSQNKYMDEKIKRICSTFISKIRRNNIFSSVAITETDLQRFYRRQYLQGIQINQILILIHKIVFVMSIISLAISQSFVFAFQELKSSVVIRGILVFSCLAFLLEIIMNLTVVKRIQGNYITNLKDIVLHYLKSGYFFIDLIIFIIITINLLQPDSTWNLILLFALLFQVEEMAVKLNKLEQYVVKNYYYEKYIALLKIMLFNFLYAHAIAVLLNQIAINNSGHSWQTLKGIQHNQWSDRYIWSYYWATTIMLTVGFGDIVPTNSNEALCVIFIEFASCIAFSYNISCLGTLISNIKSQNEETQKNRKIFEGMDKKIKFSGSLFSKIQHFINESAYIRSKFNISQEKSFIQNLPAGYRNEVTCQTNKKLLKPLPFFSCLLDKTIYKIAKHMERHIYYPQETIKTISSNFAIYVLQNGKIGYICKKFGSKYNNVVANEVKVQSNSKPFILAQEFITLKKLNYEIKSLGYSVIHKLNYEPFLEEIQKMKKDYEYFTFLRDKSKHIIDEYQTVECQTCKAKHTAFDCPKFHYMPIHQQVRRKYLQKQKHSKNARYTLYARRNHKSYALGNVKSDEFGSKDFQRSETGVILRLKLTDKQEQMKRFVVNFYNFYEKPLAMKKHQESPYEESTFKTLKNISNLYDAIELQGCQNTDFWPLQLDTGFDYDIYFPTDNPMHLVRKYNFQKRIVRVLQLSTKEDMTLRVQ